MYYVYYKSHDSDAVFVSEEKFNRILFQSENKAECVNYARLAMLEDRENYHKASRLLYENTPDNSLREELFKTITSMSDELYLALSDLNKEDIDV